MMFGFSMYLCFVSFTSIFVFLYYKRFDRYFVSFIILFIVSFSMAYLESKEYINEGTITFRCTDERIVEVPKQYETLIYKDHEKNCFEYRKFLRIEGGWKEVIE